MHLALWVLAATSLVGAGVSLLRPAHEPTGAEDTVVDGREPAGAAVEPGGARERVAA
jgi:hypothetical protein